MDADDGPVGAEVAPFDSNGRDGRSHLEVPGIEHDRYRRMVETSYDGVWVVDADGRFTFVNDRLAHLLGWEPAELIGTRPLDLMDADHAADAVAAVRRRHRGARGEQYERRLVRRDGTELWLLAAATSMYDDAGRYEGTFAMLADITERKLAERELIATLSLTEAILDSTADGILVVNRAGRIVSVNPRFHEMWQVPPAVTATGDALAVLEAVLGTLADPDAFVARSWEIIRDVTGTSFDLVRCRDGRAIERSSRPYRIDGTVAGRVWSYHDVTDAAAAAERLRQSEERFRGTFEHAAVGIAIGTAQSGPQGWWGFSEVNLALCAMVGRSRADLLRLGLRGIVHRNDHGLARRVGEALLSGERLSQDVELRLCHRDGSIVRAQASVTAVRDADGRPLHPIGLFQDVTEQRRQAARLRYLAYHDDLTGLPNRAQFEDRLRVAVAAARRGHRAVAVLNLDLDNFKLVNDGLGHAAGDEALRQVADRLTAATRADELVARHAGDETLVLLRDLDPATAHDDALRVARRIQGALRAPFVVHGAEFLMSASIGISALPADAEDEETLLRHADTAMYASKRAGPGRAEVYVAEAGDPTARLSFSSRLRQAMKAGGLVLHYQPVVRLAPLPPGAAPVPALGGRPIVGVEALLRWVVSDTEVLEPDQFIPAAEESGLIEPLTEWVLAEAARVARRWDPGGRALAVSVNLSPVHLRRHDIAERLAATIAAADGDPRQLIVEVTEGTAMQATGDGAHALAALRELGLRVAIDDFGTGYSSLGRLLDTRADFLKVDRSIVARAPHDGAAGAILGAAIAMARGLGMDAVAEGIETEAQRAFAASLGYQFGQGFLFCPPVLPERIDALLSPVVSG